MRNRSPDARREVIKRAMLCVVWGIVAGVAYLGLIGRELAWHCQGDRLDSIGRDH